MSNNTATRLSYKPPSKPLSKPQFKLWSRLPVGRSILLVTILTLSFALASVFVLPRSTSAQTIDILVPKIDIVKARLIKIISTNEEKIAGTEVKQILRTIEAEVLEGTEKGKTLTIENDHLQTNVGDKFYMQITHDTNGAILLASYEAYRLNWLIVYLLLFIVLTVWFGGMQGVRGLLSLFASIFVIFYVFLPELIGGGSPLLISTFVSAIIIVLGSYVTHGFNRTTSSAVIGMLATVIATGLLAFHAVHVLQFTGISSDEAVYLNFNTQGTIDLKGLLMGGIIIGLLGILYDVAIGQAIIVEELLRSAPHLSIKKIFERAIRIGREHIGALVNNLALAYVGVSLPLLLLFYTGTAAGPMAIINREDISTEIARTLIGSIGLVMAVPITTLLTIFILRGRVKPHEDYDNGSGGQKGHHHGHSHIHGHSGHAHTQAHTHMHGQIK